MTDMKREKDTGLRGAPEICFSHTVKHFVCSWLDTYVDQPKVVFINGKLFRSNLLFQGRGIGALQEEEKKEEKKRRISLVSQLILWGLKQKETEK